MMDALANASPQDLAPAPGAALIPALEVQGVSHAYGERKALVDVSIAVPPGAFAVLLGLNGAGKSTLFSLVTRLFAAQRGDIRVFGRDLRREPGAALSLLGVVFQARTLDLDLSLEQNLRYHAALHGIGGLDARARSKALLAGIGLAERAKEKARSLSGGQMRRLEIARALLHNPRLLLLDEPTVGLDVEARASILKHVRGLVSEEGVSALWATHLIDEVAGGDLVIVLHRGKVLAQATAAEIVKCAAASDMREAFATLTKTTDIDDWSAQKMTG
jgi:ABC-2 type transport system ATP-binding protein